MQPDFSKIVSNALTVATLFFTLTFSFANADTIVVNRGSESKSFRGEVVEEARDGSILFQTADGQLRVFASQDIISRETEVEKVPAMSREELGAALLDELPSGFKLHETEHYVIAYQTELAYAKWIGNLYEKRLYSEFEKFAKSKLKRFKLDDPEFPMAAIVFGTQADYMRFITRELGGDVGSVIAYYNQMTNRVAMYDLTFQFGGVGMGKDERDIEAVLSQRAAIPMVSTIIHEGTHQLMYNRGMQTRMADGPLWLNEGLANWFEPPYLKNKSGWRYPGLMNVDRVRLFKKYLLNRPANSLETLIGSDDRFRGDGALVAYAESWALVYFLLKKKGWGKKFRDYVEAISEKRVGVPVDRETRLKEFEKHFGDLKSVEKSFLKYMNAQ